MKTNYSSFAIVFSFTNQRLISPNPTEFTGLSNYRQLLGIGVLTLDPLKDASGAVQMTDGAPVYPAVRSFTRYRILTDPRTEIPATDVLPRRRSTFQPHIFSEDEIGDASSTRRSSNVSNRSLRLREELGMRVSAGG